MRKDIETLPVPQAFFASLILLKNNPLRLSVHFYTILPATLDGTIPKDRVLVIFEDRASVVKMWRELGLTCLQVAPGEFSIGRCSMGGKGRL